MSKRFLIPFLMGLLSLSVLLAGCQPARKAIETDTKKTADSNLIRLSPEALQQNHLETIVVTKRALNTALVTTGEVKANENKVFHINSFVSGRVAADRAMLGDAVHPGQVLAVIQNLDVAKIQASYIHELHQNEMAVREARLKAIQANRNFEREKKLFTEGISPKKDFLQAQTDAELAHADLEGQQEHTVHIKAEAKALLGSYNMRPQAGHSETIPTGSPLLAPRGGIVTRKNITLGDMVTPDTVLYEVADLSQVWLDLTIYPKDLPEVHEGLPVAFKSDSLPGKTFTGKVNYVQPVASEPSATFLARVFLPNPQGLLKPGMFGEAVISRSEPALKPYLPEIAVQKFGKETFVFLDLGQGTYRKTDIKLGEAVPGGYLINDGVQAGDIVVGTGSFTLKAELLKSQFEQEE